MRIYGLNFSNLVLPQIIKSYAKILSPNKNIIIENKKANN